MTKVMDDSRHMTQREADNLMRDIAELEIEVVRITAKFERMITDLKSEAEARTTDLADRIAAKSEELRGYIKNNPQEFKRPKSRQTPYGKYGRRNVANIKIDEPADVIKFSDEHKDLQLYHMVAKIDKSAVKAALRDGLDVSGARLITGEESYYNVEKKLLENAKKNVLSS